MNKRKIVVCDEHTIGVLYNNFVQVLRGLVWLGAKYDQNHGESHVTMFKKIRLANLKDFDVFRVSPVGYVADMNYEFVRG